MEYEEKCLFAYGEDVARTRVRFGLFWEMYSSDTA